MTHDSASFLSETQALAMRALVADAGFRREMAQRQKELDRRAREAARH